MARPPDRATTEESLEAAFAAAAAGRRAKVRRGRKTVAVVPLADLRRLEKLDQAEDQALLARSLEALAEHELSGEEGVSLDELRARHGL